MCRSAVRRAAAVFTRNQFRAAPVTVADQHLEAALPRYLLINAGNANAGTGAQGLAERRDARPDLQGGGSRDALRKLERLRIEFCVHRPVRRRLRVRQHLGVDIATGHRRARGSTPSCLSQRKE